MPEPYALYDKIARAARNNGATRLVLYGSRARGDAAPRSDIDLAVFGMPRDRRSRFWAELEELPTLLRFDIAYITPDTSPLLLDNIERDGVTLYEKNR